MNDSGFEMFELVSVQRFLNDFLIAYIGTNLLKFDCTISSSGDS